MASTYYTITPAVDTQETGSAYPAVECFADYNFYGPNSVYHLRTHVHADFQPEFRFQLATNANPTDLLSVATFQSAGLLVSPKFHNLLLKFRTIPMQAFEMTIKRGSQELPYFWLHFVWDNWHTFVNWRASTFRLLEAGAFVPTMINSYEEYLNERSKSESFRIAPDKAVLLPIHYDLYSHPFDPAIKISVPLAHEIVSSALSGIEITPAPHH